LVSATSDNVVLRVNGVDRPFAVARYGDSVYVDSPCGPVQLTAVPRFSEPGSALQPGSLVAPMPGAISRLGAQAGDAVTAGQPIVWMEAMKMEHAITAPKDGVVAEMAVEVGQQVELGAVLARVESPE
jgi:pyruvate carboxylase subunit A/propionyl-CoA carboxylase alpha chain